MKALKSFGIAAALLLAALSGAQDERAVQQQVVDAVKVYKAGNIEDAKKAFEVLYEKNPNNSDVTAWLGFIYMRLHEAEKAVPVLERAVTMRADDLEVLNNLGAAYMQTNQHEKALDMYRRVSEMKPEMFEPWYNMGNIYLRMKDYPGAARAYGKASSMRPDDPYILNNLGYAHQSMGNHSDAATAFAKASNRQPDNKTFARNAAFAYMRMPDAQDRAVPFLERAYNLDKSDVTVALGLADAYSRAGRKSESLRIYNALDGTANTHAYWYNLGVLRSQMNDMKGAELAYRRALAINGADIDTLNNLGLIAFHRGDYKEAAEMFEKLVGMAPNSVEAKMNLAAASMKMGNVPRAIDLWKDVVKADPNRRDVRLSLANALWQAEDSEGAHYHYQQVLREEKGNAEAHNGMGLYHIKNKNWQAAESSLRAAVSANPRMVTALNNLAVVMEKRGKRKEAIGVLEKAIKIEPRSMEIKKNLERMKAAG